MSPEEAAVALREEIEAALAFSGGPAAALRIQSLKPPSELGPDTAFRLTLESAGRLIVTDLPTGLAVAYLADEEAAVDEFKCWLAGLVGGGGESGDSGATADS